MKMTTNRKVITAQMQLVNDVSAGWKSQVLFVLLKMGVFDLLMNNPLDIGAMSKMLNVPQSSLKRLLDCGASLGYLSRNNSLYYNSDLANKVLVRGKPGFMGNWLLLCSMWYDTFGKLEEGIRTNNAVEDVNFDENPLYKERFIKGMIDYARYRGSDIMNYLDLSERRWLLDVGCGPAVYSTMFCEKYPSLKICALDLPHTIEIAKNYIADNPVADRIQLVPSNYLEAQSLGRDYDVVFLSHVLHQEDKSACIDLLNKSYDALNSGGILVVQAMFTSDQATTSPYAFLHDLLALLIFPGGINYSVEETIQWLQTVGFTNVSYQEMSIFNINSLVIGEKD